MEQNYNNMGGKCINKNLKKKKWDKEGCSYNNINDKIINLTMVRQRCGRVDSSKLLSYVLQSNAAAVLTEGEGME